MPDWTHPWKRKGGESKDPQRPGTPTRPSLRHNAKKPSYASGRSDFSGFSIDSRNSVSSSFYEHDEATTPSKGEYALEATKKTLEILQGVSGLVPFPLVREVIELGINLIGVCEAVGEVQGKVQELQARITEFLLVIAKAASDGEKVINNLTDELDGMKTCLVSITHRLEKISKQNKFLLALFPQPSQKLIDQCATEFQDSIQRFQVLRGIHAAQDLTNIQAQIAAIYGIANKGVQELTGEVRDVKEIVGRVEDSVAELKSMMKFKAPTHSVIIEATMPDPPEFFFGRDEIVTKIASQLASGDAKKTRVCILGPGGAGKTSTAITIMNHPAVTARFAEHHRYWMPCIGANSPGAFLLHLAEQLRATGQPDNPLSAILSTLQESHEPRVILLDNFETVWRPGEGSQEEVKKILRSLNSLPHLAILMTMRSSFPPIESWTSENLLEVASEDSRRIYTAIDPSAEGHPDLGKLLDTLGHLPYAVTLMATRGKRSCFDPKRLLDEWERRGPAVLSRGLDGMDHSIELSIEDPMLQQTPDAKKLLQVLSLLPAGLYNSDLSLWAASFDSDAIDILRDTALVATRPVEVRGEKKLHIFVLPVVQSYMRHGRIEEAVRQEVYRACFAFLSKHKVLGAGPNNPDFKDNVPAITAQETNIHALVTHFSQHAGDTHFVDPTLLSSQLDGLIAFAWYQAWTRPQPDIGELVVNFARKTRDKSREAEALFCLAHTLYKIQRFEDARRAYAEVAKLYRSLDNHLLACRSEISVIQCMQSLGGSFPELEKLINEAYQRYGGDQYGQEAHAWLDLVKANTSRIKGGVDNAEALKLYRNAQNAFSELGCRREAAVCQQSVSKCLAHEGNYAEAIKEWDAAARIFEEIGLPSGIFRISKVRYLKASGQWGEELTEALKAALEHSQVFGSPMNVAQALDEFAEVYLRAQDWAAARVAYEGALVQCRRGTGYTLAKIERRCINNLKFIDSKKGSKTNDTKDEIKLMTPSRF